MTLTKCKGIKATMKWRCCCVKWNKKVDRKLMETYKTFVIRHVNFFYFFAFYLTSQINGIHVTNRVELFR